MFSIKMRTLILPAGLKIPSQFMEALLGLTGAEAGTSSPPPRLILC